jgi:hypothetical protein
MASPIIRDFATKTSAVSAYYCDSSRSDDSGDGLTLATAKKTWAGLDAIVPDIIRHNTLIRLKGTFSDFGAYTFLPRIVMSPAILLIDGGSEVTEVVGTTTATGATASVITGGSATNDQYMGYWLEILSCSGNPSLVGQIRTIQTNVSNAFTLQKDLSGTPSGTTTFRITRPTMTISAPSVDSVLTIASAGTGFVVLQRIFMSGSLRLNMQGAGVCFTYMAGIIHTGRGSDNRSMSIGTPFSQLNCRGNILDPSTFALIADTTQYCGPAFVDSNASAYFFVQGARVINLNSLIAQHQVRLYISTLSQAGFGFRCRTMQLYGSNGRALNGITGNSGYAPTTIYGDGTSIVLLVNNSSLILQATASGNMNITNGNWGVYSTDNSVIDVIGPVGSASHSQGGHLIVNGGITSVSSGGVGNPTLAKSDTNAQIVNRAGAQTTWATVIGGTPLTDSAALSVAVLAG